MKVQKINLDSFERCEKDEATLIISPATNADGTRVQDIYFKRRKPLDLFSCVDDRLVWSANIRWDTTVSQDEYNKMIDWWFDNISEEYRDDLINSTRDALELGFDIKMSVNKAKMWLKTCTPSKRKSYIGKFLMTWVVKGAGFIVNKNKRFS